MLIIGVVVFPSLIFAQIQNGDFETPDPNSPQYFTAPLHWERTPDPIGQEDCYAGLHSNFTLQELSWEIYHPFEGDKFVLLSTGWLDFDREKDYLIKGSTISQEVFLYPGDTILGAYFFGTSDYRPFNDSGKVYLELADPNNYPDSDEEILIPEAYCDVNIVGSFKSTLNSEYFPQAIDGWVPFTYTVEPNQLGPYFIRCEVSDYSDAIYPSYFAVDGLRICRGGKSPADLNDDCAVNFIDFSILSKAWLAFCPEPPYDCNVIDCNAIITDPNIPCQLADITNDGYVDPDDLKIMSEDWLL